MAHQLAIVRAPGQPTLLMFVHPRCACSRASMTELRKLMQRVEGKVDAHVLFVLPKGASDGWEGTALHELARSIPGAVLTNDLGGVEAARFSAGTSGLGVLYDAAGQLQFQGGITSLRGHEGDSFGQERIVTLVNQGSADRHDSPVFGCLLAEKPATDKTP